MPGIFAAGDVRHGSVKRVASAVGEGSIAVGQIYQYLQMRARSCSWPYSRTGSSNGHDREPLPF
jgi:pyruvate/2-oxoglutarate dehydrogenase complex dihydrolipoamide dehydrogenase (E3) component